MKKIIALGIFCLNFFNTNAQNLINNASFENNAPFYMGPGTGTPEYLTFSTTSTPPITNWIVDANIIDLHHQIHGCSPTGPMGCPPAPGGGNHHIDVNPNGKIHQSGISLTAGNTYVLSFWKSQHCGVGGGTATANVYIGPSGSSSVFSATVSGSTYIWDESRFVFVAPSTMIVDLTFEGNSSPYSFGGVLIDSVVLRDSVVSGGDDTTHQTSLCSDTCYWKVEGNNILAPNRNIFGTLTNDNVRIFTNNQQRGVLTNTGDFGWNTFPLPPTAKFHVNVTGLTPLDGIRFEGLMPSQDPNILSVDPMGNVHIMPTPSSGISSACSTQFFIPKVATVGSPDLDCSQIFDDGTSVGIGSTGPFGYTPGASLMLGTPPPPATFRLSVNGWTSATAFVALSDKRLKKDIKPIENALEKISKLNGVTYNWNRDFDKSIETNEGRQIGFLAQDLEKVIPEATVINEKGIYGVTYDMIIPVLTEAIKEQQTQIEELKKLVAQNSNKNSGATGIGEANKSIDGYLAQNTPNPFSNNTEIKYQLPKAAQTAMLGIYDLNGKQIRMYPINTEQNSGSITVQANDLQAGMYLYTLVVDGKAFDTKRMVLTAQ